MKFRFENLDSIRTFAFMSTFLAHAFHAETAEVLNNEVFKNVIQFRKIFSFGVPVFFVLSGFLISFLMLKEQEKNNDFKIGNFYLRRILRIWPVYFIVLFIGFVVFPMVRASYLDGGYLEPANPLFYMLFLSNFDQIYSDALPFGVGLGPTWSVSIEEQFYLIWPVFLLLFPRRKFILPILFVLMFSMVVTPVFEFDGRHTIYCLTYLSIGGLFAYLSFYYNSFIIKITRKNPAWFIASIFLMFYLMYLYSVYQMHFIMILPIALLIGYVIVYQCYSGTLQMKKIPFFERLGKYTYGLYLYHVICSFIIYFLFFRVFNLNETTLLILVVMPILSLLLSLVLSYVSYHYFEMFFLRLKSKFSRIDNK